jgi:hypothetical protein
VLHPIRMIDSLNTQMNWYSQYNTYFIDKGFFYTNSCYYLFSLYYNKETCESEFSDDDNLLLSTTSTITKKQGTYEPHFAIIIVEFLSYYFILHFICVRVNTEGLESYNHCTSGGGS